MLPVSFGLHQHISHGRARSDKSLKKHEKSLRPWLTIMWWQDAFPCLFFRLEHHRGFPSRVRNGRGTGNIYSSAAGAHQRLLISIGGWATITSPRTVSGTQPGSDVVLEDVNCANVANSFFVMIRATTSSSHRFHVALSCDFVSYLRSFGIELRFASVCLLTVFFCFFSRLLQQTFHFTFLSRLFFLRKWKSKWGVGGAVKIPSNDRDSCSFHSQNSLGKQSSTTKAAFSKTSSNWRVACASNCCICTYFQINFAKQLADVDYLMRRLLSR